MPYQFPPDVDQLVREQMASGKFSSEDDLIREALLSLAQGVYDDDYPALQEALAELEAGDPGVELDEAFRQIRQRYGLEPGA